LTTKARPSQVVPRPRTVSRTVCDTRVPMARWSCSAPNSRTLVLMRTSSRNSVAVPRLAKGRLPSG
jgi:hypothetical protein